MSAATIRHVRWPPTRFYWSVIDGSGLGSRRLGRQQLGNLFEDDLPVPIEQVHFTTCRLPDRRWLACGVRRAVLDDLDLADVATLTPESLPTFVDANVEPASLNLLTGHYAPTAVRRARGRQVMIGVLGLVLVVSLLVTGIERRVAARHDAARALHAALDGVYTQVLGEVTPDRNVAALRLLGELRALRTTRDGAVVAEELPDVSATIATALSLWPAELFVETESVIVTESRITIRGRVPTSDDAQALADALAPIPGWRVDQPSFRATRGGVEVTLQIIPETVGAP